jgi:hypothetical protein
MERVREHRRRHDPGVDDRELALSRRQPGEPLVLSDRGRFRAEFPDGECHQSRLRDAYLHYVFRLFVA